MTISYRSWVLLAITTFFYTFQNAIRVSPSVMMNSIMGDFGVSASDFGQFSSAYYLGYAIMHIPFGLAFDRMKLRNIFAFSVILTVAGLIPLLLNMDWFWVVFGRFFVGAGSSGAILSMFKVFRNNFPSHWFSLLLGSAATVGVLGSVYGSRPIDILQNEIGYQSILWGMFFIGIALSCVGYIAAYTSESNHDGQNQNISIFVQMKSVFSNKTVMFISLFAGFMVGPLEGFADVWAVPFLETVYGFERSISASLPSLVYIGFSIGCPLLAVLSERSKQYYGLTIGSGVSMALIFAIMLITHPSPFMVAICFTLLGIFSGYQVLTMTLNVQAVPKDQAGLTTAVTNMIVMSFGSFFHTLISYGIHTFWDGEKTIENVCVYSPDAYIYGMMTIPLFCIFGSIGFILLKFFKNNRSY